MRLGTSNRHLYIKKKSKRPGVDLKNGKSSLPQAWTTNLQESSRFASFTWLWRAMTLVTEVREDLYFKMSSLTHSEPATAGLDNRNPTLWLCRTRGNTFTSPSSLPLLTPPEAEGGRITVIETGSPAAIEGYALLWRRQAPPHVRHETLTLSEEEDSLS